MHDHCSKLCAPFSERWVEAGALQLGLLIPPRFVAQQPRLLKRATGIPGLTTGAITELLGTEALAPLVKLKGKNVLLLSVFFQSRLGLNRGNRRPNYPTLLSLRKDTSLTIKSLHPRH